MDTLDLARWQFGITTVYHFFFVPITIGLFWLTAFMQTAWRRTRNEAWLRLTRFMGKLLLINVAIGVATGLVQEFEFGMNWSTYARFVGDVFGAPLAIEGLAAFFLESTFLGLWISAATGCRGFEGCREETVGPGWTMFTSAIPVIAAMTAAISRPPASPMTMTSASC